MDVRNLITISEELFKKADLPLDEETRNFLKTAGVQNEPEVTIVPWAIAVSAIYSSTERLINK